MMGRTLADIEGSSAYYGAYATTGGAWTLAMLQK